MSMELIMAILIANSVAFVVAIVGLSILLYLYLSERKKSAKIIQWYDRWSGNTFNQDKHSQTKDF